MDGINDLDLKYNIDYAKFRPQQTILNVMESYCPFLSPIVAQL